jgi:hypothetical protein
MRDVLTDIETAVRRTGERVNALRDAYGVRLPRRQPPSPAQSLAAAAVGALALGVVALGAVAIGRLAIQRLVIRRARIQHLEVDELVVGRLHVVEREEPAAGKDAD